MDQHLSLRLRKLTIILTEINFQTCKFYLHNSSKHYYFYFSWQPVGDIADLTRVICKMQYTELCKLNKKQLELKAHECNIDSSLPRKALVNILCLALNISTSGGVEPPPVSSLYYYEGLDLHQIEILKTLGPQNIFSANVYLNKDCGCLPDLDDGTVKKYLLKTKVFSDVERKSYKLSRPFQLKRFIHTLRFGRFVSLLVLPLFGFAEVTF